MSECKCDMRTKLVGDGCEVCNPAKALDYAKQTIADLEQERDALAARVALLEVALTPRRWTAAMSDAWHRNIPDTQTAFRELLAACSSDEGGGKS